MTGAPGQPDEIPDAFARYQLATFPADLDDFARNETAMRWKHLTGPAEREFWRSIDAAQEPDPAGESSPLGLKLAVTSNRLGHALAALREIRGSEGADSGDLVERAVTALADDAAIRDNVALTREPEPAPELPCTPGEPLARPTADGGMAVMLADEIAEARAEPKAAPELSALVDRLWAAYVRWGRHAGEQKRLAEQALSDPVPERRNVAREGHQAKAGVYQAVAAEISDLIGESK